MQFEIRLQDLGVTPTTSDLTKNSEYSSHVKPWLQKHDVTSDFEIHLVSYPKDGAYATLGMGTLSDGGNVTDRNNSNEQTIPRKCERIAFADACNRNKWTTMKYMK